MVGPLAATGKADIERRRQFAWRRVSGLFSRPFFPSQEDTAVTVMRASARPTRQGAAANFTGTVWQDEVVVGQAPSHMRATVVSFERAGFHAVNPAERL
jgi:hypothetical protein